MNLMVFRLIVSVVIWSLISLLGDGKHQINEVIIIGGGVAGLAAARTLMNEQTDENIHVTILEARRDRYGGRIWTDRQRFMKAKGAEAELGSLLLNFHIKSDPLPSLLREWELSVNSTGRQQLYMPGYGRIIEDEELQKVYLELVKITKSAVDRVANSPKDQPFDEAIQQEFRSWKFEIVSKDLLESLLQAFGFPFILGRSTKHFDPELLIGWDTVVMYGLDELADRLLGGASLELPVEIELEKVVRQIKIDKRKKKVIVRTTDMKQRYADAVIVTLPLNVLKEKDVLFEPNLPVRMYEALDKIDSVTVNNVILGFDTAFWPADTGIFKLVSENGKDQEYFPVWINMNRLIGKPFLMATTIGKAASFVENAQEADIKEKALEALRNVFGADKVASHNITTFLRSQWQSDPFTRNSISFPKPGCSHDDLSNLSHPVCPYIYFAGEHTSPDLMGTVHGAYQSGVRAANQMLSGLCQKIIAEEEALEAKRKMESAKANATLSENLKNKKSNKTVEIEKIPGKNEKTEKEEL